MVKQQARSGRESGSGLVLVLGIISALMVVSAALTMTSMIGVRAIDQSKQGMRVFYLADSGAQSAISKLRISGGTMAATTFYETINQGSTRVDVTHPTPSLYKVLSTATLGNDQKVVEVFVKFTGGFASEGAVAMNVSKGVKIKSSQIHIGNGGGTMISGMDHDAAGALLADQTLATYALSTNPLSGNKNFNLQGTGTVEGVPTSTTNTAAGQQSILTSIRNAAKTSADVQFSGSRTLGDAQTGLYGTAAAPKLVYANLTGAPGTVTMTQSFKGYGTLVIDAWDAGSFATLRMDQFSSWYGLVLVYFPKVQSNVGNATPFIGLSNNAKIVGGLGIYFNCPSGDVLQNNPNKPLDLTGSSAILYSSELLSTAPGTANAAPKSAEVMSYRIP